MKTICVLTATRAEYGLLKPVIVRLIKNNKIKVNVAVTGMHLSNEFGLTYKEIENDGIPIDTKIDILLSSDSPQAVNKTMALATLGFSEYFEKTKPDMLLVLGDRYETLAVCIVAMNFRIPIAHISGGETTEGAIDEAIRHCITKMSYLHFTAADTYSKRVIQLGENPERVFTAGYLGVENVITQEKLTIKELSKSLDFEIEENQYVVVTFHPVTLELNTAEVQVRNLLSSIEKFPNLKFIFTKANADSDGRKINAIIDEFCEKHSNCKAFFSLGMKRYLSALQNAKFMLGNSSSGISEGPAFGIPTVNIGDRQKGRLMPNSVICCNPEKDSIIKAMNKAVSDEFLEISKKCKASLENLPSIVITKEIENFLDGKFFSLKKKFWDI